MAITINGKTYRNLQEQVQKNIDDIEELSNEVSNVVTKDDYGNVNGVLKVAQLQSEHLEEDDDCKSNIYLSSGLRKSTVSIMTEGEESGSSIILRGTTSEGSEGVVEISGTTNFATDNRITVTDNNSDSEEIAYLSDISSEISTITSALEGKQNILVSGNNIKTINNQSVLGSGNINITGGSSNYVAGSGIQFTPTGDNIMIEAYLESGTGISITNNLELGSKVIGINNSVIPTFSDLSTIATTGAYSDLIGKPNLAAVATSGNYSDLTGTPTERTYYCTMKIKTTDSKTYVFSKYFTTTENVMPSSGHNWYGANMLKYIRYGGSVWFCSSTADGTNIPVQTLIYADYVTSGSGYIFDAYNINGYMNTFSMDLANCNVYLNEV